VAPRAAVKVANSAFAVPLIAKIFRAAGVAMADGRRASPQYFSKTGRASLPLHHSTRAAAHVPLPWQVRMRMTSLITISDQNSNISNQNTQQIIKIAAVITRVECRSFSRPLRCAPRRSHSPKSSIIAFVVASVMFGPVH
jgi:hypothetical protein